MIGLRKARDPFDWIRDEILMVLDDLFG